jgi:5-oxoprolinase (ATP-hydrolysing)
MNAKDIFRHDPFQCASDQKRWQFWIDRGGTFTDLVAKDPHGQLHTLKLLSENPEHYKDAAVEGIRRFLSLPPNALITSDLVECVKMGTTVATNALLERKGERTVLVTTEGFRDALRIATQARPRLFDRHIVLPEMLYEQVIEVPERLDAHGVVLKKLDEAYLRESLQEAFKAGLQSCAIVLMHAWKTPVHEEIAKQIALEVGFKQISVSHDVCPLMKFIPRGDTTVVDAYLSPILRRYVQQVSEQMPNVRLLFMKSSGGLTDASYFRGKDSVLSGPAGGIVGMVKTALEAGHPKVIGFDMGGTSTDVSHFAGELERTFDTEVAGIRMRAPMMSIHTVAAGGGSVIRFDGARLRVGPESAGANPGPACYRKGGPLTTTDANVMLGRIRPSFFPKVFGPQASEPIDRGIVVQRFTELAEQMSEYSLQHGGAAVTPEEVAWGGLSVAVGSMANAIKKISVARGYDVTEYTLQCFGGAGGQAACLVADALGMSRVLLHPLAGVLSAYGMGLADQMSMREMSVELRLTQEAISRVRELAQTLREEAQAELEKQGVSTHLLKHQHRVRIRYEGTDTAIECGWHTQLSDEAILSSLRDQFEQVYLKRFSFLMANKALFLEAIGVECFASPEVFSSANPTAQEPLIEERGTPVETVEMFCPVDEQSAGWRQAKVYRRENLPQGTRIEGPAIIAEKNGTTVLEAGWGAVVTSSGCLELNRIRPRVQRLAIGTHADPVMLEVFNNLFMNIAEQMGLSLQNTASSINIKERLDFSCAVFDSQGDLIANAPHIPVHLGSMSESIKSVIARNSDMVNGDVFVLNDPYHGGTHLPDITVITPVFLTERDTRPAFYVASRGHHGDVGGIAPGSMPPNSTHIQEEGVLLDNVKLVSRGEFREQELIQLLQSGPHPCRNVEQNLADLRAQVAANEKGCQELRVMVRQFGADTVAAYMKHVQDNAEENVRRVITALKDGSFCLTLDNGATICVAVRVDVATRSAEIDFTGTSEQLSNNFNAPKSITMAAVLYVFRTLVDDAIPLNAGCLKPLKVIVPEGCMLNPRYPAAVVAGNVETSSCVTNALYGALGAMAASQCTMNNFTFGDHQYQYYETIAGGSGAGEGFHGASVVQTHMTNSRLTDPEVLEWRYPVRLESFTIREGSGGQGRWSGGDGGERRILFLAPMMASILSNGREHGAFGAQLGHAGDVGRNWVVRSDGRVINLGHVAQIQMNVGDLFVIQTPGGGGWGKSETC